MKYLFTISLILTCFIVTSAHTLRIIIGRVMDEKGNPIVSVSIKCENGAIYKDVCNASSDIKGNYTIAFPGKIPTTLVFSADGYITKKITIGSRDTLNVVLIKQYNSKY